MKIDEPIQIASLTPVLWRNGGGITRNLAVEPENAGFDHFLWRLSFAEVNAPGRFSLFPGVDRSILVWKGNGLLLHSGDGDLIAITPDTEPHIFRGEDEIEATLINGPTIDFNVMVRRGRCTATVNRYRSESVISRGARRAFFLCAAESFRLHLPFDQEVLLRAGESLPISNLREGVKISPGAADALMIVVLIDWPEPAAATVG